MSNKKIGFLFAALLLSGSAHAQVFNPQTTTLDNGLQIVVLPNHRAPVVTQMIWYKSGAMDDPWGKSGIAHFCEHLMFKGTPKYPDGQYSKIISKMGGTQNAFTSYDYTSYYATVGKEYLEKVMELEADRMANWQVTDQQVVSERQVILKERQQRTENDPVSAFFENVNASLYPNHPYQRPVIGWRSEMEGLNRQDAINFHKAHYAPNNAILIVGGDVELPEVKAMAEKYYGIIPKGDIKPRHNGRAMMQKIEQTLEKISPLVHETIWSKHRLLPAARPETLAQSDAMEVLQKIMGDGRIGRLYRRLVVKDKIATSASISFNSWGIGPQRFAIVVTPEPGVDLQKINATVNDEIQKILASGVSTEEVKKATKGLEVDSVYARDSLMGPAMTVGTALTTGLDLDAVETYPVRIRKVTKIQVDQVAKDVFADPELFATAILRPETK